MELFKLLGTISIDSSEANKALDDVSSKGEKTEGKLSKFFGGIGKGAAALGKTVATGLAAGGAAMGTLTVKSLNMAGELEQNMGGSEAVFKEYATSVQATAKEAFSNMGLSTSDYLATANKMGALFQGAGFTIEESMNLSSGAMQRAADVASIMGIDTSAAMEAIAGAAKGNFTMMDNLGVAMNDTTLQAYALEKGITKTTSEMTNQEKIGLAMEMFMEKTAYAAGNYAKENETLAGSLGTAKAALTNFLDGSGDVEQLVTAFSNFANVVVKNLSELAPRLISGISDCISQVTPMLPPILQQLLPVIIEGAVSLISSLAAQLPSLVDTLTTSAIPQFITGLGSICEALISALPQVIESICAALPTLLPLLIDAAVSLIVTMCENFTEIIMPIIDILPEVIVSVCNALLDNLPALISGVGELIVGLCRAFPQILVALWEAIKGIFTSLAEKIIGFFEPVKNAISNAWEAMGSVPGLSNMKAMIEQIWGAIKEHISTVINAIKDVLSTVWTAIKDNIGAVIDAIKTVISSTWETIKTIITNVMKLISSILKGDWEGVKNAIKNIIDAIKSHISTVWNAIKNVITTVLNSIKNIVTSIFNSVSSIVSSAIETIWKNISSVFNGIKNTISSVFNGIKNTATTAWKDIQSKITDPVKQAKDKVKEFLDTIKGYFDNLKIKFPHIKMPHFKITGEFSIEKKTVPRLSIEWYKKAMNAPMVLNEPTIFGYNPATGQMMGGGEAGSEVVSGVGSLVQMIRGAVAAENNALVYYLNQIVVILADYFPQLLEAFDINMSLDGDLLVAGIAPKMNKQLAIIKKQEERGR